MIATTERMVTMHRLSRGLRGAVLSLCLASAAIHSVYAGSETFLDTVQRFSRLRYKQVLDLSQRFNHPLPDEVNTFFIAASGRDARTVSNSFAVVGRKYLDNGVRSQALRNELRAPVVETIGIWDIWTDWQQDSELIKLFYKPVMDVMPQGSIYFGGTDWGRFVIAAVNDVQTNPPVFCLTQNQLADVVYPQYLQAVYGDDIWVPESGDCCKAFQQLFEDVKSGRRQPDGSVVITNGRVRITGVLAVMEVNGNICRMIFDHNKASHSFFVEESYVIKWMYPYLEPAGLIMKLNPEPLSELSAETVQRSRAFWAHYETVLLNHPGYKNNAGAQHAFAKLRSAQGGLYVYRKMYREAEQAFRQAIRLCPASPEPYFRLAEMYEKNGRISEAVATIRLFMSHNSEDCHDRAVAYLKKLETANQSDVSGNKHQ